MMVKHNSNASYMKVMSVTSACSAGVVVQGVESSRGSERFREGFKDASSWFTHDLSDLLDRV
jgi:hypothetical protein